MKSATKKLILFWNARIMFICELRVFRKGLSSLIKSFLILKLVDEPVHQIPSGCDETKDLPVL